MILWSHWLPKTARTYSLSMIACLTGHVLRKQNFLQKSLITARWNISVAIVCWHLVQLGWSDGNSFVSINHCFLSAADDKNLLCRAECYDGRSLARKRRSQSRRKATDVMVELIHSVQKAGIAAKYVVFDSWFSSPKTIQALKKEENLDIIAMIKKSSKIKSGYQDKNLNIKEIYSRNKKRRGRSRYRHMGYWSFLQILQIVSSSGERMQKHILWCLKCSYCHRFYKIHDAVYRTKT